MKGRRNEGKGKECEEIGGEEVERGTERVKWTREFGVLRARRRKRREKGGRGRGRGTDGGRYEGGDRRVCIGEDL